MNKVLLIALALLSFTSHADTFSREIPNVSVQSGTLPAGQPLFKEARYRIGIIDTGYDATIVEKQVPLCTSGHYDFNASTIGVSTGPSNHGTVIAALIAEELEGIDFCLVIYQVQDASGYASLFNVIRAISKASKDNLAAVNISLVGNRGSHVEKRAIDILTKTGTQVFAAAGNDNQNLDQTCNAYPACYEVRNLHAVGALNPDLKSKASFSNYGTKVDLWYMGYYEFRGQNMPGTSIASPRALSDYVRSLLP